MKATKRWQIAFRVDNREFDSIERRAREGGFRSISEYLRHLAIYSAQINDIEKRLSALEARQS